MRFVRLTGWTTPAAKACAWPWPCRLWPCRPYCRRAPAPVTTPAPRTPLPPRVLGVPFAQHAFLVKNDTPTHRGTLRTVSLYIGNGALPSHMEFSVRLYYVTDHGPGENLLTEALFLYPTRDNEWYTLDLAPYGLDVPETGYFVALEFLLGKGAPYDWAILPNYTPTGPVMRPVVETNARTVWYNTSPVFYNSTGRGWTLLPVHNGLFGRYGAMIKLEVAPAK